MTPLLPKDHPTLVNIEAILAGYGNCIPPLHALLPHLANATGWISAAGSIYFKPPAHVDSVHDVYVLVPLHIYNPVPE